jgi:predicted nicotinamide N-methyase
MILGKYLVNQVDTNKLSLTGKQVLELGAGTGIVGLFAASLGSHFLPLIALFTSSSSLG